MVWYIFFFNYFNGMLSLRIFYLLEKLLLIITILILVQLHCDKTGTPQFEAAVVKYFRINGLLLQQGKKFA